jgi:site-specific recombinase XerD
LTDAIAPRGPRRILPAGRPPASRAAGAWLAGKRSAETRAAYRADLRAFGRWLLGDLEARDDPALERVATCTIADLVAWRDHLAASCAPATVARRLAAVRAFSKFLRGQGYRLDNPAESVEAPRVSPELQRRPFLEAPEVRALIRAATTGPRAPRAIRNRTILALLASVGLRRAELLELRVGDVDLAGRTILVRHGKGDRPRRLDVTAAIAGDLEQLAEGLPPEARLFRFGRRRLGRLLEAWARAARLEQGVSPHALRRTFATVYLDRGGSIEVLRRSLGHSDPRTTAGYDRRRQASAVVEYQ